jgi:hypothetical protein
MNDMFTSKSLTEHLLRGMIGFGSVFSAFELIAAPSILSSIAALGLIGVALFALRGCPMCWTVGLFNTVFNKTVKVKSCKACIDFTQRTPKT